MIDAIEHALTHYVPVVIGPAPYFGVEFINQIGGRLAQRCFDGFSDARQEAFDRMVQHGEDIEADAIIGMRYDATEFSPGVTEVLAYGTAVQVG